MSSLTQAPAAPALGKVPDAMALLGYKDRSTFYAAIRRDGIPCIRINPRVIRFDMARLTRWANGDRS